MHKNILGLFLFGLFLLASCNKSKKTHHVSQKHLPKIGDEMNKAKKEAAEAESIDTLTMLSSKLSPEAAKAIIEAKSTKIVQLISRKSFASIGKQYTHPIHGIRFSPYSNVALKSDQVYASTQILKAWGDVSAINWGTQDGKGGDILLSFPKYYEQYIYNKDYKASKKVKYNETEGTGNMIDNWLEIYPNAIMVEYYMDGTDPKFGGMDWGLLRLFFEIHHGKWWLVGIAHGEWTT